MYFFKTFWWPTPVFLDCLYFIKTWYEDIIFAWELRVNLWSSSGLEACLLCIRDNEFVVEAKVRRGVVPFSPIGDRTVRKLRFAWTIHIYFLITQPGRSIVHPGHTSERMEAAEYFMSTYIVLHYSTTGGFIKAILRGVRCTKSLRVLFLHRWPPSWTTLVLYSRAVFIFNEPALRRGARSSTSMTTFVAVIILEI